MKTSLYAIVAILDLSEFENPLNSIGVLPIYNTREEAEAASSEVSEMLGIVRPMIMEFESCGMCMEVGRVDEGGDYEKIFKPSSN